MAIDSARARSGIRRLRSPTSDVRSELDGWVIRLRACGATDDEVAAAVTSWDDFDPEFGPTERAAMIRWGDDRIREELDALRAEYERHQGR